MFGLSHRLWWPPELTEQLQITGRLFIYLYTSYINLYTPDQICAGFSSILSFKGGNNLLVFPRNFLGEKIPRGEDNPKSGWWFFLKLKPNPGITETLISQSQKPRFSVSVRVWCFFLVQTVLETVRTSDPDFMNDAFSCTLTILTWETLRWDRCWLAPAWDVNLSSLHHVGKNSELVTMWLLYGISPKCPHQGTYHQILSCIPSEACGRLGLEAFAC